MADRDIGSLIVMDKGGMVGMLSFREVIKAVVKNEGGRHRPVRNVMDDIR